MPAHRLTAEKKAGDCDCDDDYGTYGEDRIISQRSALPGILVVRPISRSISCNRSQHREPSFTFSMGDIASGSKFGQTTLWIEMPDKPSVKLEGYEEHFWNVSILLLLRSDDMDP